MAWHLHSDNGRWRFRVEPNANKIVATEVANVSQSEVTEALEAKVRSLFSSSGSLGAVHFPAAPGDVADAPRLQLVVLSPAEAVESGAAAPPRLVRRIADRSGTAESLRTFRNGLVFAVAETAHIAAAREKIGFELAAKRVVARQQKGDFSAAVLKKLKELAATAELESPPGAESRLPACVVARAGQQRRRCATTHAAVAASRPGEGQRRSDRPRTEADARLLEGQGHDARHRRAGPFVGVRQQRRDLHGGGWRSRRGAIRRRL